MDSVRDSRWLCACLWMFVLALAIAGTVTSKPDVLLVASVAAVVMTFVTAGLAKLTRHERLLRPGIYRAAVAILLATALAGVALAIVPAASEKSRMLGVFFAILVAFASLDLVATGPHAAMWTIVGAMWSWLPFAFVASIGCKRRFEVLHWSETGSLIVLRVVLLLLPVLAIATLLAFSPRRDAMPDARVVR